MKTQTRSRVFWVKATLPIFVAVGGIGLLIGFLVSGELLPAIIIGIAAYALAMAVLLFFSSSIISRLVRIKPLHPKKDARLVTKVEHLCLLHGFEVPKLRIIKSKSLNAVAYGLRQKNATLAITVGSLKVLDSVELEAMLAHELSRIRTGITRRETFGFMLLVLPFGRLFERYHKSLLNADLIMLADRESVKLTRYPPGLLSVLDKMLNEKSKYRSNDRMLEILGASSYKKERLPALSEFWGINV